MVSYLKEERWVNPLQVAGVLVTILAFLPLVLDMAYCWALTVPVAVVGLGLLGYGYAVAFRFDPNAGDPEPRKVTGQRIAVWGDQLTEALRASETAESVRAPEAVSGAETDGAPPPATR